MMQMGAWQRLRVWKRVVWVSVTRRRSRATFSTEQTAGSGSHEEDQSVPPHLREVTPEALDRILEAHRSWLETDDSAMRLVGNTALADLMRSGEIQRIYDKWFNPGPTEINMPISSALKTAFEIQALPY